MSTDPRRPDYDPHELCQAPEPCDCPEHREEDDIEYELEQTGPRAWYYRGYNIRDDQQMRWANLEWTHEDYDGIGDKRYGFAEDLEDARRQIDELEQEIEGEETIPHEPDDAWSGGFADNH